MNFSLVEYAPYNQQQQQQQQQQHTKLKLFENEISFDKTTFKYFSKSSWFFIDIDFFISMGMN